MQNKIFSMVQIAICTAILVVCALVTIPMPSGVPITLQTFGVALVGYLLGFKKSIVSLLLYIALGVIGLPVFSGFGSGFGALLGYTGGFIWGFVLMAGICGLSKKQGKIYLAIPISIVGLLVCDVFGAIQYAVLADLEFIASFALVAVPYLVKDIICVVVAYTFAKLIIVALNKSGIKVVN